jgi:RNA polymerase-interacting CarD/CdnL/TRCF family regulator
MPYQVDETIVLSGHGIGRIAALVNKSFGTAERQSYYEVVTARSTVWVAVETAEARGLRALASRAELDHCRDLLRSRPVPLGGDHLQRRHELNARQKLGTLQAVCELVRDLSARDAKTTLNDVEKALLQGAQTALCEEWAAVDGVPLPQASSAVTALLLEGRQQPAPG